MAVSWIQDGLALLAIVVGVLIALTGWLWRHSTRLTRVETRIDGQVDVVSDIRAMLVRIEARLNSMADKR